MSNPIDELFKRAFPKKDYPYSNSYWDKFQADLPPTASSGGIGSGAGGGFGSAVSTWLIPAAASIVGIGVGILATTLYFNTPSSNLNAALDNKQKIETLDNKSKSKEMENETAKTTTDKSEFTTKNAIEVLNSVVSEKNSTPAQKKSIERNTLSRSSTQPNIETGVVPGQQTSSIGHSQKIIASTHLMKTTQANTRKGQDANALLAKPESLSALSHFSNKKEGSEFAKLPLIFLTPEEHNIDLTPIRTETEFGEKISSHSSLTYFAEVMAGYQYIDYDGFKGLNNVENIQDILLKITSHYEVEAGVNFGAEWNGLQFYSGIHFNSLQQSYNLKFTETSEHIVEHIEQNTYLDKVDSSFIDHEVGVVKKDGKEYLGIVNSVYSVDSIYRTTNDTTYSVEVQSKEKKESASYRLAYAYLPVMLGYKVQFKKIFVQVHTGFTLGILTNYSGNIFDEETGRSIKMLNDEQLNKTTWRYNLSAGIGYQINPRVSLSINPSITHSLNGPFKSTSNHAYNYTGYGLNTAIRYNF